MSADLINGLFELGGACALTLNVLRLLKDKKVQGVHWASTVFFNTWGFWNLIFFYPGLHQWWSFAGGAFIVAVNTLWLMLVAWFSREVLIALAKRRFIAAQNWLANFGMG